MTDRPDPTDARWDLALWRLDPQKAGDLKTVVEDMPELAPVRAAKALPADWSDRLFLRHAGGVTETFYELGLLDSTFPTALLQQGEDAAKNGHLRKDKTFHETTGIPNVLAQAAIELSGRRDGPPIPYLSRVTPVYWKSDTESLLSDLLMRLDAELAREAITDIIIAPSLGVGGAERVAYWHYLLLKEKLGRKPLLILGDRARVEEKYNDLRILPLLNPEKVEGDFFARRGMKFLVRAFEAVMRRAAPETVHVVQSFSGFAWLEAIAAKQVSHPGAKLMASFFCAHYHPDGVEDGYHLKVPYLEAALDWYVSDNRYFVGELQRLFALPDAACQTLDYPAPSLEVIPPASPLAGRKGRVLWAARFDHQKQPAIVPKIAALMPDVEFHMFGGSVVGDFGLEEEALPENLTIHGPFSNFFALPLAESDIYLNTALFEGVPQALVEASSIGLPIVASAVGGVPEVIDHQNGRLVYQLSDPAAYVTAIRALLEPEANARARAGAVAKMRDTRSFEKFCEDGAAWFARVLADKDECADPARGAASG